MQVSLADQVNLVERTGFLGRPSPNMGDACSLDERHGYFERGMLRAFLIGVMKQGENRPVRGKGVLGVGRQPLGGNVPGVGKFRSRFQSVDLCGNRTRQRRRKHNAAEKAGCLSFSPFQLIGNRFPALRGAGFSNHRSAIINRQWIGARGPRPRFPAGRGAGFHRVRRQGPRLLAHRRRPPPASRGRCASAAKRRSASRWRGGS
jgi:hypothetical protein